MQFCVILERHTNHSLSRNSRPKIWHFLEVEILSITLICVNCCYFVMFFQNTNRQLPQCLRGQLTTPWCSSCPPRHSVQASDNILCLCRAARCKLALPITEKRAHNQEYWKWDQKVKNSLLLVPVFKGQPSQMAGMTSHVPNENKHVKNQILKSKQMSVNYNCSL